MSCEVADSGAYPGTVKPAAKKRPEVGDGCEVRSLGTPFRLHCSGSQATNTTIKFSSAKPQQH